jgi:hypothetical protein
MSQEPLGTLLLRRGLITNEQLATALADQQATHEPLGHILVARGYATPATVALALATQHGGLLKTEYGFATGFETTGVAVADVVDPEADRDAVRAELSLAAAETEKLRGDNARLTELRSALEQRFATASQRAASLERELVARDSAIAELIAARDAAVHELTVERSELERERAAAFELSADPWAEADRHLLFFQGSDGYELVERDGPPPAPGTQVQLENGVQVVARVAGATTPGARVPCAYLLVA